MVKITKEAALHYHEMGKPGKIEVVPTKPYRTQTDLSLAYSPGVAEPCLFIGRRFYVGIVGCGFGRAAFRVFVFLGFGDRKSVV